MTFRGQSMNISDLISHCNKILQADLSTTSHFADGVALTQLLDSVVWMRGDKTLMRLRVPCQSDQHRRRNFMQLFSLMMALDIKAPSVEVDDLVSHSKQKKAIPLLGSILLKFAVQHQHNVFYPALQRRMELYQKRKATLPTCFVPNDPSMTELAASNLENGITTDELREEAINRFTRDVEESLSEEYESEEEVVVVPRNVINSPDKIATPVSTELKPPHNPQQNEISPHSALSKHQLVNLLSSRIRSTIDDLHTHVNSELELADQYQSEIIQLRDEVDFYFDKIVTMEIYCDGFPNSNYSEPLLEIFRKKPKCFLRAKSRKR
ncbi:hypothetical protein PCE1_001962 [Barthelona sp. PCE]